MDELASNQQLLSTYGQFHQSLWPAYVHHWRRLQAPASLLDELGCNKNGDFTYISDYTSSCTMQPSCTGSTGGNQFASFLLGLASAQDRGFVATNPATRATLLSVYGQDQYRLTKNFEFEP